jgi:colicin import membrane protein
VDTTHESSVMFNLRQLMHMQEERVAEEMQRTLERRLAEERARLRAAAEQAERVSLEDEARQRARLEREAVLLRVQLEAAAAERARKADTERAHAQALAAVQAEYRARSARLLRRAGPFVSVCLMLAAAGTYWALERGHAAEDLARGAARTVAEQTRALSDLHAQLTQLSAESQRAPNGLAVQPSPALQPSTPTKSIRLPRTPPASRPLKPRQPTSAVADDELGLDSPDPIEGLSSHG